MPQRVLVTGGCGFIGSHTIVQLLTAGYAVTCVDNLLNSCEESLVRVRGESFVLGSVGKFVD